MDRRSFIKSSIQAGLTAGVAATGAAQSAEGTARSQPASNAPPANMIGKAATDSYFTEQRLHEALGTDQLQKPTDVQVVAYNFPSWHPSKYMEGIFG